MVGLYIFTTVCFLSFEVSFGTVLPTSPVPATLTAGCVRDGKTYAPLQSFKPTPCEHCMCSADGHVMCAIADCFFSPCVDSLHDPDRCCPVCPNGENCKAPDGTIIKKGETYHPDAQTTCSCPAGFGFRGPFATCAVMMTAQPDLIHVDPMVVS